MTHSAEVRAKIAAGKRGAKNPNWKGGAVGYYALHEWLLRNLDKSGVCEECEVEARTEWANISGDYRRERSDYRELCKRCHMLFDGIAKLTQVQTDEIHRRANAGELGIDLAAEFGVCKQLVSRIKNRQ